MDVQPRPPGVGAPLTGVCGDQLAEGDARRAGGGVEQGSSRGIDRDPVRCLPCQPNREDRSGVPGGGGGPPARADLIEPDGTRPTAGARLTEAARDDEDGAR